MRQPAIIFLVLFLPGLLGGFAQAQRPALTEAWVARFERVIDLNETLKDDPSYRDPLLLDGYSRHYRVGVLEGRTLVNAVYVSPVERHPEGWQSCRYRDGGFTDCGPAIQPSPEILRSRGRGVHIGGEAPLVLDGGCGVVTLWIDPSTLSVVGAWCNGLA